MLLVGTNSLNKDLFSLLMTSGNVIELSKTLASGLTLTIGI